MDLVTQQLHERRGRILEAARELIAERGYQALTMRDLAARCRVSVPTLYNQFGSKNALMGAAIELHFTGLLANNRAADASTGCDQLIAIVRICSQDMTRLPDYHRALLGAFMEIRDTAQIQGVLTADLGAEIERALEAMRSRRQLASWVDPGVLAAQITRACVASSVGWALGELDDTALEAAMLHSACSLTLSVARGAARDALESEVRSAQAALAAARPEAASDSVSVSSASAAR
jgi:AcrR family transcriptional regulator